MEKGKLIKVFYTIGNSRFSFTGQFEAAVSFNNVKFCKFKVGRNHVLEAYVRMDTITGWDVMDTDYDPDKDTAIPFG